MSETGDDRPQRKPISKTALLDVLRGMHPSPRLLRHIEEVERENGILRDSTPVPQAVQPDGKEISETIFFDTLRSVHPDEKMLRTIEKVERQMGFNQDVS